MMKRAENFIRLGSPDFRAVNNKVKAAAATPKEQPKPGSEVFLWFPTKRPSLDVIRELHPGIRDVRLPRQNTARWCIVAFSNKEKAMEAKKVINGMKYEGSKGRKIKAKMKRVSSGPFTPQEGKVEVKTDSDGDLSAIMDEVKKEEPEDIKEEDTSLNEQKTFKYVRIRGRKRYWNTDPESFQKIRPDKKKKKKKPRFRTSTPKSEPGSILRIKPKKKNIKLKIPRKSV